MLATTYYTTRNTDLILLISLASVLVLLVGRILILEHRRRRQIEWEDKRKEVLQAASAAHEPHQLFIDGMGKTLAAIFPSGVVFYYHQPPLDHQRDWQGWLD